MKAKLHFLQIVFLILLSSNSARSETTFDSIHFRQSPSDAATAQSRSTSSGTTQANLARKISKSIKKPVSLDFKKLPGSEWVVANCDDPTGTGSVSKGILTIATQSCYEYILEDPKSVWQKFVDNSRGWVIETSMRIDPISPPDCLNEAAQIWAHDHTNLVIVGFGSDEMCIVYPDVVRFPMDTTNAFHTYRVESKGTLVKIYVDGALRIEHNLSWSGGGSEILDFGDGNGGNGATKSYWDYFSYDVFP